MREIKFRAWDKITKPNRMKSWEQLKAQYNLIQIFDSDYFELMQYTGLKDKNGVEIYEGDIVKINGHKYSVKFEIGSFMLVRCSDKTDMYEQFENCWNDDVYPLSQFYWDNDCEEDIIYECEIIGNIYETPDLLGE